MKIKTVIVGLLHTNCYIIEDEVSSKCAVIDPGGAYERISEALEGKKPEYIILTHGHFAHCGIPDDPDQFHAVSLPYSASSAGVSR